MAGSDLSKRQAPRIGSLETEQKVVVLVLTGAVLMLAPGLLMLGQSSEGPRGSESKESRAKLPEAPPIGFFGSYRVAADKLDPFIGSSLPVDTLRRSPKCREG